jgi:glucose/arabinose dehydrogenase
MTLRIALTLGLFCCSTMSWAAAVLPPGFVEQQVVTGLNRTTVMRFAPDGRLFVLEQDGKTHVVKNGALLSTPFVIVRGVLADGEHGLMGIAFDPQFSQNGYVYVYYTTAVPYLHNRVSRFTATGDVADPATEVIIDT